MTSTSVPLLSRAVLLGAPMRAMTAAMPAFVWAVAALAPLKAPVASVTVVVGSLARK